MPNQNQPNETLDISDMLSGDYSTPPETTGDNTPNLDPATTEKQEIKEQPESDVARDKPVDTSANEDTPDTTTPETETEQAQEDTTKLQPKQKAEAAKRDYSKFEEKDRGILRQVPNAVFNYLKERLPELYNKAKETDRLGQETATLKDQLTKTAKNYYDHPDAFRLSEDYQGLTSKYQQAEFEENFWQQQLLKIRNGEQWQTITGYDRDGNPILSNLIDPDISHEEKVRRNVYQLGNIKSQLGQQATQLQTSFKQNFEGATNETMAKVEAVVSKMLPDLRPKDEHVNTFKEAMYPGFRNHPMTTVAAKLFSIIINQGAKIAEIERAKQTAAKTVVDKKLAGNISKQTISTRNGKPKTEDMLDLDEIRAEMEGN